jgi:hypothetical protein
MAMAPAASGRRARCAPVPLAIAALLAMICAAAAASPKWTFFIYMLADNDLECFAIDDMAVSGMAYMHCS